MKSHSEIAREIVAEALSRQWNQPTLEHLIAQALSTAVQEEREACAKVAEDIKVELKFMGIEISNAFITVKSETAKAIRQRNNK